MPVLPRAENGRFAVVIAEFANDADANQDGEGDIAEEFADRIALGTNGRIQVLRLRGPVDTQVSSSRLDKPYAEQERVREVLEKTGAHVIVWGEKRFGQTQHEIVVSLTGSRERPFGNAFPLAQRFTIRPGQQEAFVPYILLALGIEASGYDELKGREIEEFLLQWVEAIEKNPVASGQSMDSLVALGLFAYGTRESDRGLVKRSVKMWQETVDKGDRRNESGQWARLQGMYASVLADVYEIDDDERFVDLAIAQYLKAAEELTEVRAPYDFALVHNQLGTLYRRLAMKSSSNRELCLAVHEFWTAAKVSYDGDVRRYMDVTLRGVGHSLEGLTRGLPKGQKPECTPTIDDGLWRTYQATLLK